MVGRGPPLHGRLFDGGTDGSNPASSSGESRANQWFPSSWAVGMLPLLAQGSLNNPRRRWVRRRITPLNLVREPTLLAKCILENNPNARVAIITDSDELDKQIERVFTRVGEPIKRTNSGRDLMRPGDPPPRKRGGNPRSGPGMTEGTARVSISAFVAATSSAGSHERSRSDRTDRTSQRR